MAKGTATRFNKLNTFPQVFVMDTISIKDLMHKTLTTEVILQFGGGCQGCGMVDTKKNLVKTQCKVGVWQGLADESPDVDAIYRLTDNLPCIFDENEPIVLDVGNVCPFNSQNTAIIKELFPLLYLPCFVTFRFCDILRGLIAQPIMWLYGYRLGFTKATVTQIRNEHDYYEDFISEIPMYQYSEKVFETTDKSISSSRSITDNLVNSYEGLQREGIVQKEELETLKAWLEDIS